ncbi:guided entry of tail-anchored proteins factor 1-like isoform X1 [Diachasmimorpha longicaudata]|uniref:guided entry of tail-anchored proteins factor 1-like isoform X1 n=1 Tax=Diachasmimorpha longicaudata TaxID=58733 RepID=UPI0030B9198F
MTNLLVISTSLCIFAYVIPSVIKYIVGWFFAESREEQNTRKEIIRLEQEMSSISMVDEFARYTKIQRQHTKLRENFKNQVSARVSARAKAQLFFIYSARAFNIEELYWANYSNFQGLVMVIMMMLYRSEPVMILPKGALWPLDKILSWPSTYEDSISLAMWMSITTLVTKTT